MDFLWYALLAGVGIALVAGPMGCFIVWQRMAYYSDTLSHAALLSIALALYFSLPLQWTVTTFCISLAALLVLLQKYHHLSTDTLLGILAHSSLAAGLLAVSLIENVRVDLFSFLMGDLLAVGFEDLIWIYLGGALVLGTLLILWRPLLSITAHAELAAVEGLPVEKLRLALSILLAVIIAVAMKIVGILLISALLIIPAASARRWATSPEWMAGIASVFGTLSVGGGLLLSYKFDASAGPAIVVCSALLFILSSTLPHRKAIRS